VTEVRTFLTASAAVLALSACATPMDGILTQAQSACRAGDRTACQQIPYMLEQVRIEHSEQEARRQAALLAISTASFGFANGIARSEASRPPVVIPHTAFCNTTYFGNTASTTCS